MRKKRIDLAKLVMEALMGLINQSARNRPDQGVMQMGSNGCVMQRVSSVHTIIAAMLAAISLSACMHNEMPVLDTPAPAKWRQAASATMGQQVPARPDWWLAFNDPLLNQLMETALKQNLTLQQASERITYARSLQVHELATEKPQLSLYAGPNSFSRIMAATNSASSQSHNAASGSFLAGFDLVWELPIFGKGSGQQQVTQADLQIAEADVSSKQLSLTAELVRVYAELEAAVQREKQLAQTESGYANLRELANKGVSGGFTSPEFAQSFTEEMHSTQRLRRQNRLSQEIALQKLAVLCGQPEPADGWLTELQSRPVGVLIENAQSLSLPLTTPAEIIRQRPDIKMAESQVLKAAGALGIAKADLYPKLSLEGALMLAGKVSDGTWSRTGKLAYLAPSINIPLLDWGLRREVVNQRESQLREALLAYKEAVLLAIEETENALVNFNESRAQLLADEQALSRWQVQSAKLQRAVDAGYLSKMDVFKQDMRNQQTLLQYIDAKQAWMRGYAYANKALSGTGSLNPDQQATENTQ